MGANRPESSRIVETFIVSALIAIVTLSVPNGQSPESLSPDEALTMAPDKNADVRLARTALDQQRGAVMSGQRFNAACMFHSRTYRD